MTSSLLPRFTVAFVVAAFLVVGASAGNWRGDSRPPTTPTELASTSVSQQSITLDWKRSWDNVEVAGYYVSANEVHVASAYLSRYSYASLMCRICLRARRFSLRPGAKRVRHGYAQRLHKPLHGPGHGWLDRRFLAASATGVASAPSASASTSAPASAISATSAPASSASATSASASASSAASSAHLLRHLRLHPRRLRLRPATTRSSSRTIRLASEDGSPGSSEAGSHGRRSSRHVQGRRTPTLATLPNGDKAADFNGVGPVHDDRRRAGILDHDHQATHVGGLDPARHLRFPSGHRRICRLHGQMSRAIRRAASGSRACTHRQPRGALQPRSRRMCSIRAPTSEASPTGSQRAA